MENIGVQILERDTALVKVNKRIQKVQVSPDRRTQLQPVKVSIHIGDRSIQIFVHDKILVLISILPSSIVKVTNVCNHQKRADRS